MAYVSLKTIAERVGVSTAAVSMALRHQVGVSEARAREIRRVAEELGYRAPAVLHEAMGQLRNHRAPYFQAQLAVYLDAFRKDIDDSERFTAVHTLEATARNYGYGLDVILRPEFSSSALKRMLKARNIRGIFLLQQNPLQADLEFITQDYPCILIGSDRLIGSRVHFVDADHFDAGHLCMLQALSRGYQRIGFISVPYLDPQKRCLAGAQSAAPGSVVFSARNFDSRQSSNFLKWFHAFQPDCIITTLEDVFDWLCQAGISFPQQVGVIHTRKLTHAPKAYSGVARREEVIAAAGVRKLVGMLRNGECGIPDVQEATLVEGAWEEGNSVRPQLQRLTYTPEPPPFPRGQSSVRQECIDLRAYANQTFTGPAGWFGSLPLRYCQSGLHKVCGIQFHILDELTEKASVLVMRSERCPGSLTPNPRSVTLPMPYSFDAIYFLHACAMGGTGSAHFANYELEYEDGSTESLRLIERQTPSSEGNIQDHWPKFSPLLTHNVRPVHISAYGNAELYSVYLYILEWENPEPQKRVKTLHIRSVDNAHTALGVIAITVLSD